MTATPHFLFAAMTKLHHPGTATNLHQNLTTVSSKEISMSPPVKDHDDSDLCVEQTSITELETTSVTRRSSSTSGNDDLIPTKDRHMVMMMMMMLLVVVVDVDGVDVLHY
ncbi:hypothetical protein LOAG_10626 [Loa loa]|uniref:Uncharacterized protein n=1 Tax=Loa loa TaxID=7209 RepID=A0A1S0TPJ4_LOALO|nr:hypothetical protein LOAG_10626 [Loa loa]EFO17873.1 hypothetical protein LOAG_10626 [Loa loa]